MRAAALLLALLFSGCLGGTGFRWAEDPDWFRDPCDPSRARNSANAPPMRLFHRSTQGVADRLAEIFGRGLRTPEPTETDRPIDYRYETYPHANTVIYHRREAWHRDAATAQKAVEHFLRLLGIDPASVQIGVQPIHADNQTFIDINVAQLVDGRMAWPGFLSARFLLDPGNETYDGVYVEVQRAFDLSAARVRLDEAALADRARQFLVCQQGSAPSLKVSESLTVYHGSLVVHVELQPPLTLGCRPVEAVIVDVATGAIHGRQEIGGICVD